MTDRPILFSAPMVRALLEGRKTQTRRVIEPQPQDILEGQIPSQLRISIGDRLWVREAWHAARSLDSTPPRDIPRDADIEYAATARSYAEIGLKGKLRPGMFMPRWASRLTLEVIDVRVERLQDISEEDAIAEGCTQELADEIMGPDELALYGTTHILYPGARGRILYETLWDQINGAGAWDKNPWVVAYKFDVIQKNIDQTQTGGGE